MLLREVDLREDAKVFFIQGYSTLFIIAHCISVTSGKKVLGFSNENSRGFTGFH